MGECSVNDFIGVSSGVHKEIDERLDKTTTEKGRRFSVGVHALLARCRVLVLSRFPGLASDRVMDPSSGLCG